MGNFWVAIWFKPQFVQEYLNFVYTPPNSFEIANLPSTDSKFEQWKIRDLDRKGSEISTDRGYHYANWQS